MRVDVRRLEAWMRLANVLSTEHKLMVEPDGWHTKVVDPAHVALIVLHMPREVFSDYDGVRVEAGIDTESYLATEIRALKTALLRPSELEFKITADEKGNLYVITQKEPLKFISKAIDPKAISMPSIPNISWPLTVEVDMGKLWRFVSTAHILAQSARMEYKDKVLVMRAMGEGRDFVCRALNLKGGKWAIFLVVDADVAKSVMGAVINPQGGGEGEQDQN